MTYSTKSEPIAIIGTACRFPGATSPSRLWELLSNPVDLTREIPKERFNVQGFHHDDGEHHGTTNAPKAYFLDQDHRVFDASFFNITPKEAEAIDPQQKLLLEVVYEGMERAGLTLQGTAGQKVGVFVGTMTFDYNLLTGKDEISFSQYCATGTSQAILSNRVSYFFHWNGPSMTIDTACSSSLVALHQAVLGLRAGETSMACVAGTNMMLGPEMFISESNLHMLSPNGRSRMWDEGADGYARGEGVGVLLLKTLSQALADGDHIEGIVRETGVNSDGRTKGITMPSSIAQAALIRDTYQRSGLDPRNPLDRCQFFEAHGTGTQAGDPIESEAIFRAFFGDPFNQEEQGQDEDSRLLVGSIKTVIGHTEGAAGVAGVIKAMLSMKNGCIPPNQHLVRLNPKIIPFAKRLTVPQSVTEWPQPPPGQPMRASVNSFGFGGTNAHAILERYEPTIHGGAIPAIERGISPLDGETETVIPLVLSANSDKALVALVAQYVDFLKSRPDVSLRDLTWTLAVHRSALPHRVSFSATGGRAALITDMESRLAAVQAGSQAEIGARVKSGGSQNRILGIFTGQGAQWPEMGRHLLQTSPTFKRIIKELDDALQTCPNPPIWTIEEELAAPPAESRLGEAALSQPLCTALQVALVGLLEESGITLTAVVGHSSGEIAAAYSAGSLTARDAVLIAYYRGFHAIHAGGPTGQRGGMIAVGMGVDDALDFCEQPQFRGRLYIAASNAPASVTLSGDLDAVQEAKAALDSQSKFARLLKVDTAYHSHHMDPCAEPYLNSLAECGITASAQGLACSWVSSVYGPAGAPDVEEITGRYWRDNMVQPVLFSESLRRVLANDAAFDMALEIGPHPALKGPATQTMQDTTGKVLPYTGLLSRGKNDVTIFADALGFCWSTLKHTTVDWEGFSSGAGFELNEMKVVKDLPAYPWEHNQAFYRQPRLARQYVQRTARPHELLGVRTNDDTETEFRWRNILKPTMIPWLKDHRFQSQIVVPAAAYCVMAADAAQAMASAAGSIRLVEISDLKIRMGISMGDDAPGVETLFTLKRESEPHSDVLLASFTLEWAPTDSTQALKTAVTGYARVEMGSPSADVLPPCPTALPALHPVKLDEFYATMLDIGLGYTGPFRALTSLQRRLDSSRGVLDKPHPEDTCRLALRPALLDASFQAAFAAFGAPGDGSLWTSFLPQTIKSVRFNPMLAGVAPGAQEKVDVHASITNFSAASPTAQANFTGDILIYNGRGEMEIQVEGLTVQSFSASASDDRDMYLETVYQADPWSQFPEPEADTKAVRQLVRECERVSQGQWKEGIEASPYRAYLELLSTWGRMLPALIPGLITEIQADFTETQALNHRLRSVVGQISHRYSPLRILELDLGNHGAVADSVAEGLVGVSSLASYSYVHREGTDVPRFSSSILQTQRSRVRIQALAEDQQLDALDWEESYDLLVLSYRSDQASALQHLSVARDLVKPGGYLITLQSSGTSLQERLQQCLNPASQAPSIASSAITADLFTTNGLGAELASFSTDRSTMSLSVRQFTNAQIEALQSPRASIQVRDQGFGSVLIIGGTTPETAAIRESLSSVLTSQDCAVTVAETLASVELHTIETSRGIVFLADLDDPVMDTIDARKLEVLQQILVPNKSILWLTQGFRTQNPFHHATLGLIRTVRHETPRLRLQILDLDTLENVGDLVVDAFLRLTVADRPETEELLWTTENEVIVEDGRFLIPRVLPLAALNDRYNSVRRVITQELDPQDVVTELFAEAQGVYAAKATGKVPSSLAAEDGIVTVQVHYASSWALKVGANVFAFVGLGRTVPDNRQVLTLSPSNASWVRVPRHWTREIPAGVCASSVSASLGFLFARSVIQELRPGATVIHDADPSFLDVFDAMLAAMGELKGPVSAVYTTFDAAKAAADERFRFIHPLCTDEQLKAALPTVIGTCVDFTVGDIPTRLVKAVSEASGQYLRAAASLARPQSTIDIAQYEDAESVLSWTLGNIQKSAPPRHKLALSPLNQLVGHDLASLFTVVDWAHAPVTVEQMKPLGAASLLSSDKTYLMVGLTGELGQSLCKYMVVHGARYIVVASRNPDMNPAWIEELRALGATVQIMKLDVTNLESVRALKPAITASLPPIGGVVNGAMVLSDGLFADATIETFRRVIDPKVTGSRNLDIVFDDPELEFFMMFSSLTAVLGNRGQSNYTAANMYMAGLAAQRRSRGLPGSVLDIGMLYGIGYINRTDGVEIYKNLKSQGYVAISERDIRGMFVEGIAAGRADSTVSSQLTSGLQRFGHAGEVVLPWHVDPRLTHHRILSGSGGGGEATGSGLSLKERLGESKTQEILAATLRDGFAAQLETMLHLAAGTVNKESAIIDLGVDSLVAVEIRSWFLKELDKDMPVLKVLGGGSITSLTDEVAGDLFAERATAKDEPEAKEAITNGLNTPGERSSPDLSSSDSGFTPSSPAFSASTLTDLDDIEGLKDAPEYEQIEPMSFSQARMWVPYLMLQDKTAYNCTTSYRLRGDLDVARFEKALRSILRKHRVFRTSFVVDEATGESLQVISPSTTLALKKVSDANDDSDVAAETKLIEDHVYDLEHGDGFVATLLTHAPDYHTVVFGYHHILLDGVSWQLFLQDLEKFYIGRDAAIPAANDYIDFAVQQRSDIDSPALLTKREFWKSTYADGLPDAIPLFPFALTNTRQPLDRYDVSEYFIELDRSLAASIRAAAIGGQSTSFHFYLSVLQVLMNRVLGLNDFCLGITDANRSDPSFMETIGLMIDTLPLRCKVDATTSSFQQQMQLTRNAVYGTLGASGVPLDVILNDIGSVTNPNEPPLFQALVNFRMGAIKQKSVGDVQLDYLAYEDARHPFDFIMTIDEDEGRAGLTLSVQNYLYDKDAADVFLKTYIHLLEAFAANPTAAVTEPSLFPTPLLKDAVQVGKGPEPTEPWNGEATLSHRIDTVVAQYAGDVALIDDSKTFTYQQMGERVDAIGAALLATGVNPGDRVGVFSDLSVDTICSHLAVLKVGGVYVPCDVRSSNERLADIITESGATVVLCDAVSAARLPELPLDKTVTGVTVTEDLPAPAKKLRNRAAADNLGFMMFTSGSTGKPKGIKLTHGAMLTHMKAVSSRFELGRITMLHQSALGYDASLAQWFYALGNGGRVVVSSNRGEIRELAAAIETHGVSFIFMTPSEFVPLLDYARDIIDRCENLEVLFIGGEAFPPRLRDAVASLPQKNLRLFNVYGPTEGSVFSTADALVWPGITSDELQKKITIGSPHPHYDVYVLDEANHPVPCGWPGQIAVSGPLSEGYLNRDDLTRETFIQSDTLPVDAASLGIANRIYLTGDRGRLDRAGNVHYEGRTNAGTQIKLRGIRIELADIAHAIVDAAHGVIANAVVGARGTGQTQFLVAYVVFQVDKTPEDSASYLQRLLASLPLPLYMKPARAIALDSFPRRTSGKMDIAALAEIPLPELSSPQTRDAGAWTPLELRLAGIWEAVLETTAGQIAKQVDFFSAGGNSLLLIKLQAMIRKEFDTDLRLAELFRVNTIEAQAERLGQTSSSTVQKAVNWDEETAIPAEILTLASTSAATVTNPPRPLSVVLTGSTGFLGRSIVSDLQGRNDIRAIHCVAVRNTESSVSQALCSANSKVVMHAGNLSLPFLGMDEAQARTLFDDADVIIHNGADVSFMKPYEALRAPNLGSTKELVRLSIHRRLPFFFVSTVGVTTLRDQAVIEEGSVSAVTPTSGKVQVDGYVSGKWASEIFLEKLNAATGLPVRILRPSSIVGDGAPTLDIMHNVLSYSQKMRTIPDLQDFNGHFDLIAVEACAGALVDTLLQTDLTTAPPVDYIHLTGQNVVHARDAKAFLEKETGGEIDEVSMADWIVKASENGLPQLVATFLGQMNGKTLSLPRLMTRLEW